MHSRRLNTRSTAVEPLEQRCLLAGLSLPDPAIVMYGHHDGAGVTDAFRKLIPPFTIIEGTSTDAGFITELRNQGRIYAAHVNNPVGATAAELVALWRGPFDNTNVPGGFDAIAIDELHGIHTNDTNHSNEVVSALKQLRNLYPDKQIYAAVTYQYGNAPSQYSDQLNALNDYADLIMVEGYLREGNPSYGFFPAWADRLKSTVPGILSKSVYGLGISQGGHVFDDKTNLGFLGHLDEQLHTIRNDADAATMPGMMFWVYYRSKQNVTPDYLANLVDHYFTNNNTSYLGDGSTSQWISNPQFDSNTTGWMLNPGIGGTVDRFSYSSVSHENDHGQFGWSSHGSHGLRTVRGSSTNEASYRMSGLDTSTDYNVSAWVISDSPGQRAILEVRDTSGTTIESLKLSNVGNRPNYVTTWNEWSGLTFNFTPTVSTVDIVLSDAATSPGTTLYWDFVEFEDVYTVANAAPNVPGPASAANVLTDRATITWGASTDPQGDPITYELQIRRDDLSNNWNSILTSTTSRTITGLRSDTTYRVRVRATDGQSASGWRQTVGLFTTLSSNQAPTIPGPLSATDVLPNRATIAWEASTDPQGNPITYEVQFRKEDKSDSWSSSLTTSSPFRTIAGLQSDTTYRVRVQATNGQVTSEWQKTNKLLTTLPSVPTFDIGEFGKLTNVTNVAQTVLLGRSYDNPVVFAQSASTNGQQAVVARVTGIQSDQFSIYLAESSDGDGTHNDETVTYLVLEAGTHRLADGTKLEAGTVTTSATVGGKIGNQWETVSLAEDFFSEKVLDATPVVFTQVQTDTGDAFLATRQNSITTTSFDVALEPEEASTTQHNSETVGYLAIEAGTHATGNVLLEANYTPTSVTQDWYPLAFGRQYSTPGLLSSLASYQGSDNAHVRFQHLTGGNVELKVGEDKSSDTETGHTAESVAYLAIGGSGMLSATVGQLEIGQFGVITDLTNAVQTIFLDRTFDSPVVFAQSPTANGGQPVAVRINNVLSDRFSIYLAEPSNEDGTHGTETVTYLVLEAGEHQLVDGTRLEVGTRTTGASVGPQVTDQWEAVSFSSSFASTPVVLTQIQTALDVPYLVTRQDAVSATGLTVALQQEETIATQHVPETIGYLAIESGAGVWNGHVFEAGNTGTVVTDAMTTVSFDRRFPDVPALLTSMNTYVGKDSAHVRYSNLSDEDVDLLIGEDTTVDTELTHGGEDVSYLAISGSGMLTATVAQLDIGEVGVITDLTHEVQTILLDREFIDPVVFAQSPTANGTQPVAVRVDQVMSDRFSIYLTEPSNENGQHNIAETVTYVVVDAGVHELADGTRLEVGTRTTGATVGQLVADEWEAVTFASPFASTPVVLTQIQTVSGLPYLMTRQTATGATGFQLALNQEEAITTQHVAETVGYLAIDSGVGVWKGHVFEAIRTPAVVTDSWTTISFGQSFATVPALLTSLDTYVGVDNSHLRYGNLSEDNVQLQVGEDTTSDTELVHVAEKVGYLAIGGIGRLTANAPLTPPIVTSVVRDGEADTHDTLDTLAITWDQSVNVAAVDLTLRNDSAGGTLVNLTGIAFQYDGLTRTATWDFAGVSGIVPAYYTAILNSSAISNGAGVPLDGDGNGAAGEDFASLQLVARRGDVDLDGNVDIADFNLLATNFDPHGDSPGNGWSQGNFDNDADTDITDFVALVRNFDPSGYGLSAVVTVDAAHSVETTLPRTRLGTGMKSTSPTRVYLRSYVSANHLSDSYSPAKSPVERYWAETYFNEEGFGDTEDWYALVNSDVGLRSARVSGSQDSPSARVSQKL